MESLATQTLVIFAIRTRRIPFFRSRPSVPLLLAALAVVTVGAALPASPFGRMLGFQPLPGLFFLALVLMVVAYLLLIELGKYWFYRTYRAPVAPAAPRPSRVGRRVHRRAARFSTHQRLRRQREGRAERPLLPGPQPVAGAHGTDQRQIERPST